MATIFYPINEQERARREEDYRQALASLRLEVLAPGAEARAIFQRYVEPPQILGHELAGLSGD